MRFFIYYYCWVLFSLFFFLVRLRGRRVCRYDTKTRKTIRKIYMDPGWVSRLSDHMVEQDDDGV